MCIFKKIPNSHYQIIFSCFMKLKNAWSNITLYLENKILGIRNPKKNEGMKKNSS